MALDADLFVLADQRLAKVCRAAFADLGVLMKVQQAAEADQRRMDAGIAELEARIVEVRARIERLERFP